MGRNGVAKKAEEEETELTIAGIQTRGGNQYETNQEDEQEARLKGSS